MRTRAVATIVLALLAGCATPAPRQALPPRVAANPDVVWVFDVKAAAAPAYLPADADDLVVLNTVASVIAHDLQLPLPAAVNAVAYSSEAALVDGLVRRGATLERARGQAEGAAAVAAGNAVLIRADLVGRASLAYRVFVFAHELTHIAQSRARINTPMWIVEGHADWVAYRVLEVVHHPPYGESRERVRRSVLQSATPREQFPSLGDLDVPEAWQQAVKRFGPVPTYGQAFLAVDRLAAGHGDARLREFMFDRPAARLLSPGEVEGIFWAAVFPTSYRAFVAEFREYLNAMQ